MTATTSLTLSSVQEIVNASMSEFTSSMSRSMKASFENIEELISSQIADIRQEFLTNASFTDNPSRPPVKQSYGQGRSDHSHGRTITEFRHSGSGNVEPEGVEQTVSPIIDNVVKSLLSAGLTADTAESIRALLAKEEVGREKRKQPPGGSGSGAVGKGIGSGPAGHDQSGNVDVRGGGNIPTDSSFAGKLRALSSAPVNFRASTSKVNPQRVAFDDDVSVVGDDDDKPDPAKATVPEGMRKVLELLLALCPESAPPSEPASSRSCRYEGMFSGLVQSSKELPSPVLFHRVGEILELTAKKFKEAAEAGKQLSSSLPLRRRSYAVADKPELGKISSLNNSLPRLVETVNGSKNATLTVTDTAKVEGVAKHALETHSMSFWLFNALINWVKEEGFAPSEPILFDELVQAFSLSMVNTTTSVASLATFFKGKRREGILSHFPANIGKHFKDQLLASSFDGDELFEEEVLRRVLSESCEDSFLSANMALTKAVSLPVFGGGKAGGKASTAQSSSSTGNSTSASGGRGRGRGHYRGQKRKASLQATPAQPKETKSPKGDGKGKGFAQ